MPDSGINSLPLIPETKSALRSDLADPSIEPFECLLHVLFSSLELREGRNIEDLSSFSHFFPKKFIAKAHCIL